VRDGSGLVAIQRAGITVAIISGATARPVTRRATELGIRHVHQGVADKGALLERLLDELGIAAEETACVGDDTPDAPMLRRAGLAIGVADAIRPCSLLRTGSPSPMAARAPSAKYAISCSARTDPEAAAAGPLPASVAGAALAYGVFTAKTTISTTARPTRIAAITSMRRR